MTFSVIDYHWDDHNKRTKDYHLTEQLYEKTIQGLAECLNEIHISDLSTRYWRILVGPWLKYFISIFIDRYRSIEALSGYSFDKTIRLDFTDDSMVPQGISEFHTFYPNDEYNHWLYNQIIDEFMRDAKRFIGSVEIIPGYVEFGREGNVFNSTSGDPSKHYVKNFDRGRHAGHGGLRDLLRKHAMHLLNLCRSSTVNYYFQSSHMSRFDEAKLFAALGEPYLPTFVLSDYGGEGCEVDSDLRFKLRDKLTNNSFLEHCLRSVLPKQIPKCYIEGYKELNLLAKKHFPDRASVIFTTNGGISDDVFKCWVGKQVEFGSKYVVRQHGGLMQWDTQEIHEKDVSDYYISLGNHSVNHSEGENVISIPSPKPPQLKNYISPDEDGYILCANTSIYRYAAHNHPTPTPSQMMDYQDDVMELINTLDPAPASLFKLRLYPRFHWDEKDFWMDKKPGVLLPLNETMEHQFNASRLFICTYRFTGHLTSLGANFPTIICLNPNHWELSDYVKRDFAELEEAGIFFTDFKTAANKINEIYSNPMSWWMQPLIQETVRRFRANYVRTSSHWVKDWSKLFKNIRQESLFNTRSSG